MRRGAAWLWVAFLASIPLWMENQYYLHILINTGIFAIAAMSLNLLLGYTGQLSLGHVAFFGIGAYTSALLALGFDLQLTATSTFTVTPQPVWVGFLAGIVVAGLCGWLIGKISFKIRGAYFVIVTVSFAEVVRLVALNWIDLTEGPMALNNIPPVTLGLPGLWELTFYRKIPNYYLVLVVGLVSYLVIRRLVQSRAGRAFIALRENEPLAESVGVDVTRYLVLAAVVAAALAGAAGGLYAHYIKIVDPDVFLFIYTVTMVIMVVTGGKGTLAGPVVGALIFGILPEILREVAGPEVQWILYGVIMVLIVFFLPNGIAPAVEVWWKGLSQPDSDVGATPAALRRWEMPTGYAGGDPSPEPVLTVERLVVHFGGLTALSDVSFTVRKGEVASLIGPNGAGKTTAFNVITGYLRPTHGVIRYREHTLTDLKPHHIAALGVVRTFQKTSVFGGISVFDNVLIGLHQRARAQPWEMLLALPRVRQEEGQLGDLAMEVLAFVGLTHRRDELGRALPYGEQRLLEVAVAMAAKPSLLLLDEPVSGMNPAETASFMDMVGKIRARGVTLLLVEHDMRMVMGVSDRVVVLNQGEIIATGAPADIQRHPDVIRAYLGQGARRA